MQNCKRCKKPLLGHDNVECGSISRSKLPADEKMLELIQSKTEAEIAKKYKVHVSAVYKRLKKISLRYNNTFVQSFTVVECPICKTNFEQTSSVVQVHCSKKCRDLAARRVPRPPKEVLEQQMKEMSMCAMGRFYGISDNGIRKWLRAEGLM